MEVTSFRLCSIKGPSTSFRIIGLSKTRPLLGTSKGPKAKASLHKAYTGIPAFVEGMRYYWTPMCYRGNA